MRSDSGAADPLPAAGLCLAKERRLPENLRKRCSEALGAGLSLTAVPKLPQVSDTPIATILQSTLRRYFTETCKNRCERFFRTGMIQKNDPHQPNLCTTR